MKRTTTRIFLLLLAGFYVVLFITFNVKSTNFIIEYRLNEQAPLEFPCKVEFNSNAHDAMLLGGFYYPESWGRWSRGPGANLGFKLSEPLPERVHCQLAIPFAFLNNYNPSVTLTVELNGFELVQYKFKNGEELLPYYPFTMERSMLTTQNILAFKIDGFGKPSSDPKQRSGDTRELGVGFESLTFSLDPSRAKQKSGD